MKHIVVDLEMNGLAKKYKAEKNVCGREVIEIGAVVLDDFYQEISSFKTLVKPQYNDVISPYISRLTGITTDMVKNAPVFEEALKMFITWCSNMNDQVKIYQWSESDSLQIINEMQFKQITLEACEWEILQGWEDFQKEYGEKLRMENSVSLKNAVMYAGIELEGAEHDALDDARNTATLLRIVRDPELCKKALAQVIDAMTPKAVTNTLGALFNFAEFGFSA